MSWTGSHIKPEARDAVASLLSTTLGLDGATLLKKITPARRYLVVKHRVPVQIADDLKKQAAEQKLGGIYF